MDQASATSLFPVPPMQYINLFSDENVKWDRVPLPPPPIKDSYRMFGTVLKADDTILQPLESQGIKRLYPINYEPKRELKKLNHSILVNFLDLLDILIKCPDSQKRIEKIEDLTMLFIHMHHLINEFRPHQARETLRVILEKQKREREETAERFNNQLDKVFEILQSTVQVLPSDSYLANEPLPQLDQESQDSVKEAITEATESTVDASNLVYEPTVLRPDEELERTLDLIMCGIVDGMT